MMKKLFLCVLAATTLAACSQGTGQGNEQSGAAKTTANNSAAAVSPASAPKMKFENESHDFGKITQGDVVHYDFKFTNTGKSPLIITNATATCGCTTPEYPRDPIKPGSTGVIKVTFNSAGKKGLQDKQITVTANTNPADNMVHLIGEVTLPKQ